jgi:hypothetical protein
MDDMNQRPRSFSNRFFLQISASVLLWLVAAEAQAQTESAVSGKESAEATTQSQQDE